MSDYTDRRLRDWAMAMEAPLHAVGYPPVSQMHRACSEGAEGMLAKGPISDGGMVHAIQYMRDVIQSEQDVREIGHIVARMPAMYRDLIRLVYLDRPGHLMPRRMAAEKLGTSELVYRDRFARVHGYVEGALNRLSREPSLMN